MINFLLCGLAFLYYAWSRFQNRILYPSVVFSIMWGINCIYTAAILMGFGSNLYLREEYSYEYMDSYIVPFTIVSLVAFTIAHKIAHGKGINLAFSVGSLDTILRKYKFVMWVNFFGGILRMVLMIGLVGFNLDNVMNYRLAANEMMMISDLGFVGLVFKLTAYVQMIANFYIALYGLRAGFEKLNFKSILGMFILYAPTQMATGGRLFVLYFIIFFFGSFFLARGISMKIELRKWILPEEKRAITFMFVGLLSIVAIIGMSRAVENGKYVGKESFVEKFAYITEGMLATEYCMQHYPNGSFQHSNGVETIMGSTNNYLQFRGFLNETRMSSSVICIILPLYLDFGFWGSLIVWFIIALFIESLSLRCLGKLTIIRFLILATLLKICYESVMSNPINNNIPVYELIILSALFYKPLFGWLERSKSLV